MQIENPTTANIIWNWQTNIQASIAVLTSKLARSGGAYNFWQRQVDQWHAWNANNPNQTYPVADPTNTGNCHFAMVDDQYGAPPAGFQVYADAIWIKQYNGASGGGNYVAWLNPGWVWHLTNSGGLNYVDSVCAQTP
jgi:hypothetical protein